VTEKLTGGTAPAIYDHIQAALATPAYAPRQLFKTLNIEVLATTDAAADTLDHHQAIRASGWDGRIIPTFRPDNVINLEADGWAENIQALSTASGIPVVDYSSFIRALEQRRAHFQSLGATASDFGPAQPTTAWLSEREAGDIFQRALRGQATAADTASFLAHMLCEMARMSVDDGMLMQIHPGVYRNHNPAVYAKFGADKGFDIPYAVEYTRSLQPLLERFGNHPNFSLLLFSLDEATYARELAPLAGAYPAVKLGPYLQLQHRYPDFQYQDPAP